MALIDAMSPLARQLGKELRHLWHRFRGRILTLTALTLLLRTLWRRAIRRYARYLRISAPLRGAGVKYAELSAFSGGSWHKILGRWYRFRNPFSCAMFWNAACPCCKRPLEIQRQPVRPRPEPVPRPEAKGKYAYLICLWGSSVEYVLGALVLGASIRKTGSKHDRVCLFTEDVPREHIQRLSHLWQCRRISHVNVAMERLSFPDREERFAHVFTKLQGLSLTEYEKVLMMDIDLLVRHNIDDLFQLPAPAALRRGMNDWGLNRHGQPVDGSSFLIGEDKNQPRWSWGQGTGINAGVMLWQPNQQSLDEMLSELEEPNHPEHVRGNGPEQDYLSRTWADAPWTYISAEYNFQLHQMFFALHPDRAQYAERANLLEKPEKIKIVHYSGKPTAKPWHRVLDAKWRNFWPDRSRDEDYVKLFAEEFMGYWLWILRDPEKFQMQQEGNSWDMMNLELENGEYYRHSNDGKSRQHLPIPQTRKDGAMRLLTSVLKEWFDLYESLVAEFGAFVPRASSGPSWPSRELRPREDRDWATAATGEGELGGAGGGARLRRPAVKNTTWKRSSKQSWWVEAEKLPKIAVAPKSSSLLKITASCCCSNEGGVNAVALRDPEETFDEEGPEVLGLYIKNYGQVATRNFSLEDMSPEALFPVRLWASTIPENTIIQMAIVGLQGDITPLLRILAPLGVPQEAPPKHCRALACVCVASHGGSYERRPCANHASPDVAYASLLFDPELL